METQRPDLDTAESQTDPASILPDHFPSVSVSVELGRTLSRQGKRIEVDLGAAGEILTSKGFPKEKLSDVDLYIGRKSGDLAGSTKMNLGDNGLERYAVTVVASDMAVRRKNVKLLQKCLIHEFTHVADLEKRGIDYYNDYVRTSTRNRIAAASVGGIGGLVGSGHFIDSTDLYSNLSETTFGRPIALATVSTFILGATLLGAAGSVHAAYRSTELERRAFGAHRKEGKNYRQVASIHDQ